LFIWTGEKYTRSSWEEHPYQHRHFPFKSKVQREARERKTNFAVLIQAAINLCSYTGWVFL